MPGILKLFYSLIFKLVQILLRIKRNNTIKKILYHGNSKGKTLTIV